MKIAIWGKNSKTSYSGGRIHAWLMAEALVENGHEVSYFTNNTPKFYDEFSNFNNHNKIKLYVNSLFRFKNEKKYYDLIFLIPHLKSLKSFIYDNHFFYKGLIKLKNNNKSLLIKLDFESPNWITKIIPESRSIDQYKYQKKYNKFVDGILSSTNLGMSYAKKY